MLPPEARVEGAGASAAWNPTRVPQVRFFAFLA